MMGKITTSLTRYHFSMTTIPIILSFCGNPEHCILPVVVVRLARKTCQSFSLRVLASTLLYKSGVMSGATKDASISSSGVSVSDILDRNR